jgi:hypothetical protein
MNEHDTVQKEPLAIVRYGMGKEIQLYTDELVSADQDKDEEVHVPLASLRRLTLIPGDPTPSKLVLIADLDDETSLILAEGMTNAKGFREMLPLLLKHNPDLELDPPDMGEQLRQALNNKRAWSLTCYGCCLLLFLIVIVVYLLVAYIGAHH